MTAPKFKIGDEVMVTEPPAVKGGDPTVYGPVVITGVCEQDTHEGKFKEETIKHKRPQAKKAADYIEETPVQVPVRERTKGYLVQDPSMPWNRLNGTWIRAAWLKKA